MADFDVTAPDGRTFKVTAPDGATQDQVLAYAQSQFGKAPKEPTILEKATSMANAAATLSPMGALAAGGKAALDGIDKLAYSAGGAVTDATGSPALGTAVNVAGQAAPMAVGGVAGMLAKAPLRAGAERLMQQALKPSTDALVNLGPTGPSSQRAIATMLDADPGLTGFSGYNVGRGGIKSMQGKVDATKAAIEDALKGSGATVDRNVLASSLDEFTNHIKATDLAPQDRLAAVQKLYDQIVSNTHMPQQLPVEQVQRIKQAIYKRISDAYGELGSDTVQAQKYLARSAKDQISAAVPEVAGLNAKESELLNALELARHRAFVTGNKDIGGMGWLTANPAAFAAFMVDRSPLFKSMIARMMNTGSQNAPALGVAGGAAYPQNKSQ